MPPSFITPGKEGTCGIGQAAFEKAKIRVKQIRVLGIPQAELPIELAVSMTLEDIGWALWQR